MSLLRHAKKRDDNEPEIIDALESLAVHCPPKLMTVEDKSRWMADWCEDLRDFDSGASAQHQEA